jgi:hypothetical protein
MAVGNCFHRPAVRFAVAYLLFHSTPEKAPWYRALGGVGRLPWYIVQRARALSLLTDLSVYLEANPVK